MTDILAPVVRSRRRRRRSRASLPAVVAALVLALVLLLSARIALHRGEAMPGVRVLDAEVGGLDAAAAGERIRVTTAQRLAQPVTLAAGPGRVSVKPGVLFTLDRAATTRAALHAGRDSWTARAGSLLSPLTRAPRVAPVLVERPAARRRLTALLARFGRPPVSATVVMRGTEAFVRPSRPGSAPDLDLLLRRLERRLAAGSGSVPVTFGPSAPPVRDAAAAAAAEEARLVVSAPVTLTFDRRPVGTLAPDRLAELLRFRARGSRLLTLLDELALERALGGLLVRSRVGSRTSRSCRRAAGAVRRARRR